MRILFCGAGWFELVDMLRAQIGELGRIDIWDRKLPLTAAVADVDVLLPSSGRVDRAVIEAAPQLRLIQQPAAGYQEVVDIEAARERGIPVCNAPGTNARCTAETALYLLLAISRRAKVARRAFRERQLGGPRGIELHGKTLGIVGMGQVGRTVAAAARALGMEVVGITSTSTDAERDQLFARSDFISLHCPLTEQTRGLIDEGALAAMKPGVGIVNVARGPVIDRMALEKALASGQVGSVGLDVYWDEPADPADPLFSLDNVETTPHIAGSTDDSFARIADIVIDNVRRLAAGNELRFRVI